MDLINSSIGTTIKSFVGQKVIDADRTKGIIMFIYDLHNVQVDYEENGYRGSGLYCVIRGCPEFDGLWAL